MSFRNRFKHTTPLFSNYNMLTIESINKYISLIRVHEYLHSENNNLFILYEPRHYRTRLADSNTLVMPDIRSTHSRQSVRWAGCHYWNSLPHQITAIQDFNSFKFSVKKYLLTDQSP